ncbi:MAG: hypothetical protein ACO2ZM_00075 [Francisellaceae bacterium]
MREKLNILANLIFYLSCILFIATLTAVYYFNNFEIEVAGHIVYWVYLAPLAMVGYTMLKNLILNRGGSQSSDLGK